MQNHSLSTSMLMPIGYRSKRCRYCKNSDGDAAYRVITSSLTPEFYQALLGRGWTRWGTILEMNDLRTSCCPPYAIRLDSYAFHASKGQRQTLNRFNKFILGKDYEKKVASLCPRLRDQAKSRNTDFDLLERIHESEKAVCKTLLEPEHEFMVTLELDSFTEEKYAIFKNYLRVVHQKSPSSISKQEFRNTLCDSPLERSNIVCNGRQRRLGSYHQCYRINGKLVAIGVLDLLPQCVSSVYFMYDESVHERGFGKLGALREIALAREDAYKWWYVGPYVHNCARMKYKVEYTPLYILDLDSYTWDPLDNEIKNKLDLRKNTSLSHEGTLDREGEAVIQAKADCEDGIEVDNKEDYEVDSDGDRVILHPEALIYSQPFPGVLTKEQLLAEINLDHIQLQISGIDAEAGQLEGWKESDIDSPYSIKGIIAQLAAAVGPELMKQIVLRLDLERITSVVSLGHADSFI